MYYRRAQVSAAPSPLRSDVAGLIGRTRRGEPGRAVRVTGWRDFVDKYGPVAKDATFTYAVRGYFENGGEVAYIVRLVGTQASVASSCWQVGAIPIRGCPVVGRLPIPVADYLLGKKYVAGIHATSPGAWAENMCVRIRYTRGGKPWERSLRFDVRVRGEPDEHFTLPLRASDDPDRVSDNELLQQEIAARSRYIRLDARCAASLQSLATENTPRVVEWPPIQLRGGCDGAVSANEYRDALRELGDQPEVAIMAMPGLPDEPKLGLQERLDVASAAMLQAVELQDRLVILDVLAETTARGTVESSTDASIEFAKALRQIHADPKVQRCAAIYHPALCVEDPFGGMRSPLKTMPPSGHVAGVMSRTDRERGAHYTPANTPIHDAVDLEPSIDRRDQAQLGDAGVNVLRSIPGRGPTVWGGRTLELSRDGRFVGHRRFIHRLVRVMRRVAEPLVFDTNGPELWLALLHALGTVLLEAFRAGALQGDSPEQAFRVRCDERTNPRDEREQGRVLCEVDLVLAAPMEFIQLRVALSQTGRVEVFEA